MIIIIIVIEHSAVVLSECKTIATQSRSCTDRLDVRFWGAKIGLYCSSVPHLVTQKVVNEAAAGIPRFHSASEFFRLTAELALQPSFLFSNLKTPRPAMPVTSDCDALIDPVGVAGNDVILAMGKILQNLVHFGALSFKNFKTRHMKHVAAVASQAGEPTRWTSRQIWRHMRPKGDHNGSYMKLHEARTNYEQGTMTHDGLQIGLHFTYA